MPGPCAARAPAGDQLAVNASGAAQVDDHSAAEQQRGEKEEIWIELHPDPEHPHRCSGCGQVVAAVHDTTVRWVRDLPILDADTWLLVHRVRVNCPNCGPRIEQLD